MQKERCKINTIIGKHTFSFPIPVPQLVLTCCVAGMLAKSATCQPSTEQEDSNCIFFPKQG